MLVIRLTRIGRKNRSAFRIVLQEKSQSPKSAAQEYLGSYNPRLPKREDQIILDAERITFWLSKGAQPSATVHNLLVEFSIIQGKKKRVVGASKKSKTAESTKASPAAPQSTEQKPAQAAESKQQPQETQETKEEKK